MHHYQERDVEQDRNSGRKIRVIEIYGKCAVEGEGRNGQDKVEV